MKMKKRRMVNRINAGSMADIAFLLLIFFLVTTTIVTEKGIIVRLPPMYDGPIPPIPERNVINIKLNANGELLFEKAQLPIGELKEQVKRYILNQEQLPNLPTDPGRAVISLQNDRGTPYGKYIAVYDQLKAAYQELWQQTALTKYHSAWENLDVLQQKEVKKIIPQFISEADPTDYGVK